MITTHIMPGLWSLETDAAGHTRIMHKGRDICTFHDVRLAVRFIHARVTPNDMVNFLAGLVADARTDTVIAETDANSHQPCVE